MLSLWMVLRTPNNWGKIAAGQAFNGPVQTSESLDPWQSCARRRPNVGRFRIMPFRDDVLQGGYCWAFRDEPTGPCWSPWPGWSLVLFCFFFNLHRPWGHRLEQGNSLCSTMFGPRPCGATRSCACFLLGSCQDVTICEKCYLVVPIFGRFAARLAGKEQGRAELSLCLVDGGVEMRCPELS